MKTLLFVDDEPSILQGLERQLRNMRHEWEMKFVGTGLKALEFMAGTPVDVVVSDMLMPGMDGAELLTNVRTRYPNAVRLVLSGHVDRESVLRLVGPAHQYLSKPCDSDELRAAIARALALRDLMSSERLKQLASRINCLPSLPASHSQLTEELHKEDPCLDRVAGIISKDFGMATKILQLVNSAFFGLAQPATNVAEAVMYLGLSTIRSLVVSVQVFSQFDQRTLKLFSIDDIAKHCWLTGMIARQIAALEHRDSKFEDQCFLGGLLHDLGYVILAAGLPGQYAGILQAAHESGQPVWQVEQAELGATHAEVGAYLLGLWGLPSPIIEAVALHHRPAECPQHGFSAVIAVHVADGLAHERFDQKPCGFQRIDMACLNAFGVEPRLAEWKNRILEQEL